MVNFFSSPAFLMAMGDVLTIYLYEYMHRTFYNQKSWVKDKQWIYVTIYILDIVFIFAANSLEIPIANFISMLAAYFIPLFLCFEVKNIRGITYFAFYLVGTIIFELILGASIGGLKSGMGMETHYELVTPVFSVIMNLAEIVIVLTLCHFGSKETSNRFDAISRTFMILPLISVLILLTNHILIAMGMVPNYNPGQYIQLAVVLLLINIVLFILMEKYTRSIKNEVILNEEKLQMTSDVRIMELASKSMRDKLAASEQRLQSDRLMRHDRRHFESLLLSLLEENKTDEAIKYLKERLEAEPRSIKKYCENTTLNAAIGYYIHQAETKNIKTEVSTNIPSELRIDEMELAIVISNLIENAIHACEKLPESERTIRLISKYKNQLLLTIENPYDGHILLDENGFPDSEEYGHGIGTKSVQSFIKKTDGEISYSTDNNRFSVRMIIDA